MNTLVQQTGIWRRWTPATNPASHGFTRAELLIVLATLVLLASLWLPALASIGSGSAGAGCLNNLRRLSQAWLLFAEDKSGFFAGNVDDGSMQGYNWVGGMAGVSGSQEFYPEVLLNPAQSGLAGYVRDEAEIFRCPADARIGRYQGTNVALRGTSVPAARGYSMNGAVGTQRDGYTATDGPWLDGMHAHRRNAPWRTYGRLSDLIDPAPAGLHVFLDEDAYSLNDSHFALSMRPGAAAEWIDWPGTRHEFGAGFAFADGHGEMHRWEDSRTLVIGGVVARRPVPDSPDVAWLQARTSTLAQ